MDRDEQMAAISEKLDQVIEDANVINRDPEMCTVAHSLVLLVEAIDLACKPSWKVAGKP